MPINLDYESFSPVDLLKTGAFVYFEHPETDVLCLAVKIDNTPTRLWHPALGRINEWEPEIAYRAKHGDTFKAYNAAFEYLCTNGNAGQSIGMPRLHISQMRDTAARAASLALPRAMGNCAKALRLPIQKDEEGKRVMMKLSKPRKPTKDNPDTRWTPQTAPQEFAKLYSYCINDVDTESCIENFIGQLDPYEQAVWELDFTINNRGVPVDIKTVRHIVNLRDEYLERLAIECQMLCGFSPGQVGEILRWLNETNGFRLPLADEYGRVAVKPLPSLDKANLNFALAGLRAGKCQTVTGDFATILRVLEIRQQASQSSTAKFDSMLRVVCRDGRIRGSHVYWGAGPGRWAGKFVQFQNLKKSVIGEHFSKDFKKSNKEFNMPVAIANAIGAMSLSGVEMLFDKPMDVFSSIIRPCIKASPGKEFIVRDYSSVEARIISWYANEAWRLEVFNTHGLIYEATASKISGKPFEEITKDSKERQSGKVAELALGFQGGVRALIKMGAIDRYGLKLVDLKPLVKAWREANPGIAAMWQAVENAVIHALKFGVVVEAYKCRFGVGGPGNQFFQIQLPSGRFISYAYPRLEETVRVWDEEAGKFERYIPAKHPTQPHKRTRWNDETLDWENYVHSGFRPDRVTQFVFEGEDSVTRQWTRQTSYGGTFVENIVQGTASCLLRSALFNTEAAGYENVFHVHDEAVPEVPLGFGSEKEYGELMCKLPLWATGLPLASEGYRGLRYRKD